MALEKSDAAKKTAKANAKAAKNTSTPATKENGSVAVDRPDNGEWMGLCFQCTVVKGGQNSQADACGRRRRLRVCALCVRDVPQRVCYVIVHTTFAIARCPMLWIDGF